MRSGFIAAIASANDLKGVIPRKVWVRSTPFVLSSGWRGGHTASTLHPAFARAMAKRALGNQREVAAIRTLGFTFVQVRMLVDCSVSSTCEYECDSLFGAVID
jgi:hypothetical protein